MPRRTPQPLPQRAKLSPAEMQQAVSRFEKLIDRLEEFDPNDVNDRSDPKVDDLEMAIRTAIEKTYPRNTAQYNQYSEASMLDRAGISMGYPTPLSEVREGLQSGKDRATVLLKGAISDLKEDLDADVSVAVDPAIPKDIASDNKNIFVVHGHDNAVKQEVARFIEKTGLTPVILHEQANKGDTVIEKLERHSNVGFAIVLLTPDDVGRAQGEEDLQPRARQNVIAELFYFLGRLGRDRVCALLKGGLEIPSDIGGVVHIDLDAAGAWKTDLLRELEAAGYKVDWGKALR